MHSRDFKDTPRRRMDDGDAFIPDPGSGPARAPDDFAELVAEDYIASATTGEEQAEYHRNEVVPEELGGPFLQATAEEEFADDVDEMNPEDAAREPFPKAVGGGS
jgi:hypothetical protein